MLVAKLADSTSGCEEKQGAGVLGSESVQRLRSCLPRHAL